MPTWAYGLAASATITVAFLAVAVLLAVNLTRSRHWRGNPLGVGTFLLYLTCGGGHAVHTVQLLEGWAGAGSYGAAALHMYAGWPMLAADVMTAAAGVTYWLMRGKFPGLVTGAAVYEDLRNRQQSALQIHDNVVQSLTEAELALDLGRQEEGEDALRRSLENAKRIITDLLGNDGVKPGDLRRDEAGDVAGVPHGR